MGGRKGVRRSFVDSPPYVSPPCALPCCVSECVCRSGCLSLLV